MESDDLSNASRAWADGMSSDGSDSSYLYQSNAETIRYKLLCRIAVDRSSAQVGVDLGCPKTQPDGRRGDNPT